MDAPLIILYVLLVLMGWLNIYAAVYSEAHSSILDFTQRYGQQLLWLIACIPIILVVQLLDTRFYYVFAYYIYGIILLILVLVLGFGTVVHGSKSWLSIGAFRMQPAEFAKFATAIALAKFMGRHDFRFSSLRGKLGVGLLLASPIVLILLQNDFGSAIVYSSFLLVLYREGLPGWVLWFLAFLVLELVVALLIPKLYVVWALIAIALLLYVLLTKKGKQAATFGSILFLAIFALYYLSKLISMLALSLYSVSVLVGLLGAVVAVGYGVWNRNRIAWVLGLLSIGCLAMSVSEDYVFNHILDNHHQRRINDLLGIEDDPLGWGYNVNQSMIAIGSGGFGGKGYLLGTQTKFNFVPEQSTDFIFCTVGEEWGFVGSLVVISLFILLLLRVLVVAERQKEAFHRIYGYGVASILFFHFAVNISMTIGLFPVIGIPLPFFSYGGSSLWAFTLLLFVLVKFDSSRLR